MLEGQTDLNHQSNKLCPFWQSYLATNTIDKICSGIRDANLQGVSTEQGHGSNGRAVRPSWNTRKIRLAKGSMWAGIVGRHWGSLKDPTSWISPDVIADETTRAVHHR